MAKTKIPRPPTELSAQQNKLYRSTCKYLGEMGHLMILDGFMIAMFVMSWTRFVEYELKAQGNETQTFESGATNVSADYTVMERERAVLMKLSGKLGLTVQDRAKIKDFASDQDQIEDRFFAALKE